jgi:hypothetical protein
LWAGSKTNYNAAVAWKDVCKPKREGGLDLMDLVTWNQAAMCKHLWAVVSKADTLFVKWIHEVYIKKRVIWHYKAPTDCP